MTTSRQRAWAGAAREEARRGNEVAAVFFSLLAEPNESERKGHNCVEHSTGFRTAEGRRGFRCQIPGCKRVVKWVDPEPSNA